LTEVAAGRELEAIAQGKPVKDEEPPSEGLDVRVQIHLLNTAARLLCGADSSTTNKLSAAIVEGLAALSHGWLSSTHRGVLEHFQGSPAGFSSGSELYATRYGVQALLQEVDRRNHHRLKRSIVGPDMAWDDNRPNLEGSCSSLGPFSAPLSRLRIALLPGEADHVNLYDIRVSEPDCPIATSVISRLPGYGPETVRENPDRMDIGGTLIGRYLPGTALAGQLRDGVDPSHPYMLSPSDLLGGAELDLGRAFSPMSHVYLFYRVAPGHIFCAVVEPIETRHN
jgi:hypothetical protein